MKKNKFTALLVGSLAFMIGCASPFVNLEVTDLDGNTSSVKGISDPNSNGTIRVLVIHGMTSELCPGYSKKIISAIAENRESSLQDQKNNKSLPCDKDDTDTYPPKITTNRYIANNNGESILLVDEIYYAGALEREQERLASADKDIVDSPALFNRWLKHEMMISRFGDAIAYHVSESCENCFPSQIRDEVREVVRKIDKEIEKEKKEKDDSTGIPNLYIISHSLGSNIVLDVVQEFDSVVGYLKGVYLLANQHALIGLGAESSTGKALLSSRAADLKESVRNENRSPVDVAAFSDRDDVLSYALTREACKGEHLSCVNAVLSMADVIIPFVLKGPGSAHRGYWTKKTVRNCIARGC